MPEQSVADRPTQGVVHPHEFCAVSIPAGEDGIDEIGVCLALGACGVPDFAPDVATRRGCDHPSDLFKSFFPGIGIGWKDDGWLHRSVEHKQWAPDSLEEALVIAIPRNLLIDTRDYSLLARGVDRQPEERL
jgi:hypothetical protein